jgi:hypothetical protein
VSTALAIAAVTAVLRDLLANGLKAHKVGDIVGGDVTVSALPPDRIATNDSQEPTQLNLFLYQVTPNQGWSNVGYPSRDARGERISNPPLALNLHYLLSAYGAKDLHPEILLGQGMQLLHESPVLTRSAVRKALNPTPPPLDFPAALAKSDLAEQVEQVRITLETLNTEEVSKLWSAIQAHYRPTAAYLVTVVLIESKKPGRSPLPVLGRGLYPLPFNQPVIEKIVSDAGENEPITASSKLLIKGQRLRGQSTRVLVGGIDLSAAIEEVRDTQIVLQLPAPPPAGLRAGVQPVQVVHNVLMGAPPVPHEGVESNVEAFVLRPEITPSVASSTSSEENGVTVKKGEMKIDFVPKVARSQRVVLLLNEFEPTTGTVARAYTFPAPAGNGVDPNSPTPETDSINIPFQRVIPGDYLVRVQVDGAESVLSVDASGKFATPRVTI